MFVSYGMSTSSDLNPYILVLTTAYDTYSYALPMQLYVLQMCG